jgi:predicted ArsR family transcriptional regulator
MDKYPSETRIMLALKKNGKMSLVELSEEIGISKMAILNHLQKMESKGLVERYLVKSSVGRPHYVFKTTDNSRLGMDSSNNEMLENLLDFLEKTGNNDLVTKFLSERYSSVRLDYEKQLSKFNDREKVQELSRIREKENYYPELKETGKDGFELLEYNCPIFEISRKFGVACSLETQLFASVLQMDVNSTHRQVNGSDVCRFLIKKKSE